MPIARFQEDATTASVRTVGAANADITLRDHFCKAHGPKTLARAVAKEADPRRFERLAMEKCSLGDDGAKTMASHALPALRALRGLYLCANGIGPLGAKAIASGVRLCAELHTLRLDSNRLGCSGAAALFGALPGTKIETVGMMNNGIADKGAKTLAKVRARCTALRAVNLDANRITDSSCRALMLSLPRSTLGELGLAYNNITERGEKMVERGRVAQARGPHARLARRARPRFRARPNGRCRISGRGVRRRRRFNGMPRRNPRGHARARRRLSSFTAGIKPTAIEAYKPVAR